MLSLSNTICAIIFSFTSSAFSIGLKKESPQNSIVTYFLDMPNEILDLHSDIDGHVLSRTERAQAIKLADTKNGYILVNNSNLTSSFSIALFRRKNMTPLLGIVKDGASVQSIKFVELQDIGWKDVTLEVFPNISTSYIAQKYKQKVSEKRKVTDEELIKHAHSLLRYKLPRYGNTIVACASWGFEEANIDKIVLFKLKFSGSKFEIVD